MKKCSNCGVEQPDEALFCSNCGTRLENNGSGIPASMPAPVSESEPAQESIQESAPTPVSDPIPIPAPEPKISSTMLPPTDRFASADQPAGSPAQPSVEQQILGEKPEYEAQPIPVEQPASQEPAQEQSVEQAKEQPKEEPVVEKPETLQTKSEPAPEPAPAKKDSTIGQPISVEQLLEKTQPKKKTSNNKSLKIIIILGCLALVLVCIAGIFLANTGSNNKQRSDSTGSTQQTTPVSNATDTKTAGVTTDGWEFIIPEDYVYETIGDDLVIYGNNEQWALRINYENADYNKLIANIDTLKKKIEDGGYKVTNYGIDSIDGTEYYWFDVDVVATGDKGIMALSQAPSQGTFKITLVDVDQTQNHDYLEDVAKILSTAEQVNSY